MPEELVATPQDASWTTIFWRLPEGAEGLEFAQPQARTWAEQVGRSELLQYHHEAVHLTERPVDAEGHEREPEAAEAGRVDSPYEGAAAQDGLATPPASAGLLPAAPFYPLIDPLAPQGPFALRVPLADPFGTPPFEGLP